jgi:hypothetical protein
LSDGEVSFEKITCEEGGRDGRSIIDATWRKIGLGAGEEAVVGNARGAGEEAVVGNAKAHPSEQAKRRGEHCATRDIR